MPLTDPFQFAIIIIFLALFSFFSYKKRLLDFEGVLIANAIGLAAITYGAHPLVDLAAVVVFFVLGEIASNYPQKKHERRTIWNVIGNSLPALAMLILIIFFPASTSLFELAYFGAVAAALADTLSSEIGYYSRHDPRLITTGKRVRRGTDGGITLLGEGAALAGSLVIAALHYYAYHDIRALLIVLIAGMVGTNVDSFFGAVYERKGKLNKTHVNLIGSFAGAFFSLVVGLL